MFSSSPGKFPISAVPATFGATIEKERLARGWSRARLAAAAGLDRATVLRLEAAAAGLDCATALEPEVADRRSPTADTVFRLQAALDLQPGELVPAWPEWNPIGTSSYGARSRERRRNLKLPLTTVADAAGVSAATLSRFERELVSARELLSEEVLPCGSRVQRLASDAYAVALGFADRFEHMAYCSPWA